MSIYTQLLRLGLEGTVASERSSAGGALVELLHASQRLGSLDESRARVGWAPVAVADQVAYDVALIRLSREVGIECDPAAFDPPEQERARLRRVLASCGVQLSELEDSDASTRDT
ncbi:MAG TPA: hypothetical protein VGL60_02980 [Acidimicrobiales bacterium]|jgi:hypothetical protein